MAKFKKGDRVTLTTDYSEKHKKGDKFIVDQDESTCPWLKPINGGDRICPDEDCLRLADFPNRGSVLLCKGVSTILYVHDVFGDILFASYNKNIEDSRSISTYAWPGLKKNGWKVQGVDDDIEELTMEEVCKALGKTVKIKK